MAMAFMELYRPDADAVRAEVAQGLLNKQAHVAPKFLYDALGSRLFDAITELDEYYPTRVEASIFAEHAARMAQQLGQGGTLLDLGAGNCRKAEALLPLLRPRQYVAVDVSVEFVREALERLAQAQPGLSMLGIGMDFSSELQLPAAVNAERRVVFYPGSSIGNFTPDHAERFLSQVANAVGEGGALLIGVDLRKAKPVLEAAYDDRLGVTAAFNKNLLLNVNRWLGANFDPRLWRHVALYDEAKSRIEMHLEAKQAQQVSWPGGQRTFNKGQRIHTENSYKYEPSAFDAMLARAGFTQREQFTDVQRRFGVWVALR